MEAIERIKGFCCEVTQEQWEELVRVADEVGLSVIIDEDCKFGLSKYGHVKAEMNSVESALIGHWRSTMKKMIPFPDFLAKLEGEEKWQPKAGEMVEVSGSGLVWWEREFIAKSRGQYVGWTSEGEVHAWAMCRPARHTITRAETESLLNKRIID
jgi:hypothetical protein